MADFVTVIPKNLVVALRQMVACAGHGTSAYPDWFKERYAENVNFYSQMVAQAADELEAMQELNGRLYKTLYGND